MSGQYSGIYPDLSDPGPVSTLVYTLTDLSDPGPVSTLVELGARTDGCDRRGRQLRRMSPCPLRSAELLSVWRRSALVLPPWKRSSSQPPPSD